MASKRGLRPHRSRYWLNPTIADEKEFASQVHAIADLYDRASSLHSEGVRVVSCDEKTSIQALERAHPSLPMTPGHDERREFNYRRNGTTCLIANLEISSGGIISPTLQATRTNADFVAHVERTIATDPNAKWIFITDQLNIHTCPELVAFIAKRCGITDDLGKPGRTGVMARRKTRMKFLSDPSHGVRFVYTPKHCSWLNQIENWFSTLARKLLRRGSFTSVEDLEKRIRAYIAYYNRFEALPIRWTATAEDILKKLGIETSETED